MKANNTVVLIDDHELVRAGIKSLLDAIPYLTVIGECGDGSKALPVLKKLQPDLIVLDISLKGMNGMELISLIKKHKVQAKILMLSMHAKIEYVANCLNNGANGYLLKDSAVDELEPAITSVLNNKSYIGKDIDISLLEKMQNNQECKLTPLALLTCRQRQILQLIAEGKSTREIADIISVSIKTVETHRAHIMSRLNIFDLANLIKLAINCNLVQ